MNTETRPEQVTRLLVDWRSGNAAALEALTPLVYKELRRIAARNIRREHASNTLQPTELINEAYLRMIDQSLPAFETRSHFFAVAARIMRQILVDFARRRHSNKRKGEKVELDDNAAIAREATEDVLSVHEALEQLALHDARKAQVVELRYFGGLSREEIAEALGVSLGTVKRDQALGEAFLGKILSEGMVKAPAE